VRQRDLDNTEGEASMTREEALAAIKLLSALESWSFSLKERMPDYLHDDIQRSMSVLEMIVLGRVEEKPQENYTYGTPLLDSFTTGTP
jgi:hypothetical protein